MSAATRSATAYSAARGQRPRPADAYRDDRRSLQLHLDYGIVPARQAAGLLARRPPRPRGEPYGFENHGREIVSMKKMLALSLALAAAVSVVGLPDPAAAERPGRRGARRRDGRPYRFGRHPWKRRRSAGGRGDRRRLGRDDRRGGDATPALRRPALRRPMRALGLRLQRQPRLRRVLLSSQPAPGGCAIIAESGVDAGRMS